MKIYKEGQEIFMSKRVMWITRTATFIALLIVMQVFTSSFGNTIITGSIVNFILIMSVMTCGFMTGLTVAVVSPIFAKFVGIGPLWVLIPFIIAGNIILVLMWNFIGNRNFGKKYISNIFAVVVAAAAKFLVLYISIVQVVIPLFLKLPEPKASVISNVFSFPQLLTALIGGMLAVNILPVIQKVLGNNGTKAHS
ncbi:ECF transporter S component [Wukongibacter sp. M2B1]|uniref:ECF transporter S component n=1 Tax=Wukongibacter sp. M2B1 TaxID=3088895 RepID=UPI003D7AE3E8